MGGLAKTYGFVKVFDDFGVFWGLQGGRRAILGPMLGDVGCKMSPRWVQEGFEADFFDQLGVLMGILAPLCHFGPLKAVPPIVAGPLT